MREVAKLRQTIQRMEAGEQDKLLIISDGPEYWTHYISELTATELATMLGLIDLVKHELLEEHFAKRES